MNKLIWAALSPLLLGGCTSLFGHHAVLDVRPSQGLREAQSAVGSLQEGRQALARGEIASAIVSFRIAALDQSSIAAAHNGLCVAYAKLGRDDLAERYFRQAATEDPAEPKYSANLARLEMTRSAALAKTEAEGQSFLGSADQSPAVALAQAGYPANREFRIGPNTFMVSADNNRNAVSRVSAHEVAIRTLPPVAAIVPADGRRRNPRFAAITKPQAAYPVRIAIGTRYPVRLALRVAHTLADQDR